MKHLYLLRHAKSDWDDERLDDHDRPLAPRGERACGAIGPELSRFAPRPQLALCSSARRAVDTLEQVLGHLDPPPPLRIDSQLYLASPGALLQAVHAVEETVDALLMVGHNPGFQLFALELMGRTRTDGAERLGRKLPTAGLVALEFVVDRWTDVAPAGGELLRFVTPKELGAS